MVSDSGSITLRGTVGFALAPSTTDVAGLAAPDALEQQGRRNAASDESAKSDIERGEDAHLREKIQYLLDTAINPSSPATAGWCRSSTSGTGWSTSKWVVAVRGAAWPTSR